MVSDHWNAGGWTSWTPNLPLSTRCIPNRDKSSELIFINCSTSAKNVEKEREDLTERTTTEQIYIYKESLERDLLPLSSEIRIKLTRAVTRKLFFRNSKFKMFRGNVCKYFDLTEVCCCWVSWDLDVLWEEPPGVQGGSRSERDLAWPGWKATIILSPLSSSVHQTSPAPAVRFE